MRRIYIGRWDTFFHVAQYLGCESVEFDEYFWPHRSISKRSATENVESDIKRYIVSMGRSL